MAKTILILGVGPGIGLATAARFAREGFHIIVAARDGERLRKLTQPLRDGGAEVIVETVDAGDPAAVSELVSRRAAELDVLHYNAGVLRYADGQLLTQSLDELSVAAIASDISINITGALAALHAALPAFHRRASGTILLTGGGLATVPHPDLLTLSVGKAGLRAVAQGLFEVSRSRGVHVAILTVAKLVSPGSEDAAMAADRFWHLHAQDPGSWEWEQVYA